MELKNILTHVDHTLLKQESTWEQIKAICDDGIKFNTASVCIPPSYVKECAGYCGDKLAICTVIGFPNGYNTTACKVFETADAVKNGAEEIDMVINIGWLKDKRYDDILKEIKEVKKACNGKTLKVIIETCLLTDEEKVKMCAVVTEAGADFIKTSTGKVDVNATPLAAYIMCECIAKYYAATGKKIGFKPAGGISSAADALCYYSIVASLLGKEWLNKELFRFGVSRVANSILSAVEQKTVSYF